MSIEWNQKLGRVALGRSRALGAVAVVAGTLALGAPANAADMLADDTQAVTQVEYGTGWYLRGDIGANYTHDKFSSATSERIDGYQQVVETESDSVVAYGVAVGHRFTNNLRADISLEHLADYESSDYGTTTDLRPPCIDTWVIDSWGNYQDGYEITNCIAENTSKYNVIGSLATVYYDLDVDFAGLRPFIGAGVGIFRNSYESSLGDITCQAASFEQCRPTDGGESELGGRYKQLGTRHNGTSYHLAGGVTAGLAYAISDKLSFDTTYRYARMLREPLGGADPSPAEVKVPEDFHTVKFGLRYEIW